MKALVKIHVASPDNIPPSTWISFEYSFVGAIVEFNVKFALILLVYLAWSQGKETAWKEKNSVTGFIACLYFDLITTFFRHPPRISWGKK